MRIVLRHCFDRTIVSLDRAGVRSHDSLPLSLGYFVFSDLESPGDLHAMSGFFVRIAGTIVSRTAHREFPRRDPDELNAG
jgi:hypothetical protein